MTAKKQYTPAERMAVLRELLSISAIWVDFMERNELALGRAGEMGGEASFEEVMKTINQQNLHIRKRLDELGITPDEYKLILSERKQ